MISSLRRSEMFIAHNLSNRPAPLGAECVTLYLKNMSLLRSELLFCLGPINIWLLGSQELRSRSVEMFIEGISITLFLRGG